MIYQSPKSVISTLECLLSSNPNRSLSGVFKALRREQRINLIGDYPLLSFIIHYGYSRTPRYKWSRFQMLYAIRISGFYKDEGRKQAYIPKEWEKLKNEKGNRRTK